MSRADRRLDDVLRQTSALAPLLARMAAGKRAARFLTPLCRQAIPGLDLLSPGTCDLRGGILRITCQSNAHANKLRQVMPRLRQELESQGVDVTQIKVTVQPRRTLETPSPAGRAPVTPSNTPSKNKELSSKILETSISLSKNIQPGALQDALRRLARSAECALASLSGEAQDQQNHKK
jgi:preprotein translocase subunit SecD